MWDESTWNSVDGATRRLEDAWKVGGDVELAEFVPAADDPHRLPVLATLIKIDQEHHWQKGTRRLLEAYLGDWPELDGTGEILAGLLAAEYRTRESLGDRPLRDELKSRFPAIDEEVVLGIISREANSRHPPASDSASSSARARERAVSDDREHPPRPAGSFLGRYEIVSVLGRGGMGTVYLARDDQLKRTVAVKELHPKVFSSARHAELLLAEARIAASLEHPSIVPIHDVATEQDESLFFVMAHVEGHSLAASIRQGEMDAVLAAGLCIQVADALDFAHQKDVVHRDIKPENILIDEHGGVHVTDFGLAILTREQPLHGIDFSGTLPYMAPEQVAQETHQIGAGVDIWAMGAVLYEMLTAQRPFTGKSFDELSQAIQHQQPTPLRQLNPNIPEELERICLKCLSKRAADRYITAADFANDLRKWQQRSARSRFRIVSVGVISALVLGALWAVYFIAYAPEKRNVALAINGSIATADSVGRDRHPVLAIDDDEDFEWTGRNGDSGWWKVEFPDVYYIDQIEIVWVDITILFNIEASVDGESWNEVVSQRYSNSVPGQLTEENFSIAPTWARFVRVNIRGTSAVPAHLFQASIAELRVYESLDTPDAGPPGLLPSDKPLVNEEFQNDLSGWRVYCIYEDRLKDKPTPGKITWSPKYGGSAKVVVSGEPSVIDLQQRLKQPLPKGSTITMEVISFVEVNSGDWWAYIGGARGKGIAGPETNRDRETVSWVTEKHYHAGTSITLYFSVWPGTATYYVKRVSVSTPE